MPKLGSGNVQFQGCPMGQRAAICICFHTPSHVPNKDKIEVYLTKQHVDQDGDFSLVLDADGNEDVVLHFGNQRTFGVFKQLVNALATAEPSSQETHQVLTREEYNGLNLKGWHEVCHDYDGAGNTALRYRASTPTTTDVVLGWQPIETAPKDGRTLLLGYHNRSGKWRTVRGQWYSNEMIAMDWEEPDDGEEGWYETAVEADGPPDCWSITPTHWMPLPAPPYTKER